MPYAKHCSTAWDDTLFMLSLSLYTVALANSTTPRYQRISTPSHQHKEIYLTATQYEVALIQVLSEICPPMLNARQKPILIELMTDNCVFLCRTQLTPIKA